MDLPVSFLEESDVVQRCVTVNKLEEENLANEMVHIH